MFFPELPDAILVDEAEEMSGVWTCSGVEVGDRFPIGVETVFEQETEVGGENDEAEGHGLWIASRTGSGGQIAPEVEG